MKEKQKIKKSNSKGIILLIAIIIIAIIVVGTIIYQNNKNTQQEQQQETEQDSLSLIDMNNTENAKIESGVKENTSENISKDRKLGNLSITDIKLSAQDGVTSFTATVKNDSNKETELRNNRSDGADSICKVRGIGDMGKSRRGG